MYIYLLHYKSEALDTFKIFKAEVEKQCAKQIKIIRSGRCGEYYGRYMEIGQAPGPFVDFLQKQGIIAQCTLLGSLDQNGVVERRNHTLMDMVKNMLSNSKLPLYLWIEAFKRTTYILNKVSTKAIFKTPLKLWKGWKLNLRHIHI